MPNPRLQRKGSSNTNAFVKGNNVTEKSMSFHGRGVVAAVENLRRPWTVPDLVSTAEVRPKLAKVLLNVTIQGSVGAVQVLLSSESTVRDLISASMKQYAKEGRRPVFCRSEYKEFDLHYSQFSLESLDREEKLAGLGSRNFFLCKRKVVAHGGGNGSVMTSSCSKQAEKATKLASPCPLLKFIGFLF